MKNLAEVAQPLYELLKKNCVFIWTSNCEHAFQTLKNEVINATQLRHFNPDKPLILATAASSKSIGTVLLLEREGIKTALAHASKVLTKTQKRYSQIEREILAVIFGV